jgi:hypothetical protein
MSFQVEHEIHKRRFGRNLGVGVLLVGMVAIVFALTVVKVTRGAPLKGFDHVADPQFLPAGATE